MVKFRKIIFWAHLTAGLLAGIVILVMSLTGVCLAFEPQIINWQERELREVAPPGPDAKPLDVDALLAKVRNENPASSPTAVTLRSEPRASVMATFGRDDVVYLNPYDGQILGHGSKIRGVLLQIENVHRWLGASDDHRAAARAVTGAGNAVFLMLAASGLYLWWPRSWSASALRPAIWFADGLRGKARDWNWHNTIGLWCAPVLIVLTLSGVIMSYQWANNLLYKMTGNEPPPPQAERSGGNQRREKNRHADDDADHHHEAASFAGMIAKAAEQMPDWSIINLRLPQRAGAPVTISIQNSGSPFAFYRSQLTLNSSTGEVMKWEPFTGQNLGRKLRIWARFLHTGEALGVAGQCVAAMACAGGALLVWTGFAMAWRRFFGRKQPAAAK
ncbi:MAG TPA: PepSY-associated TM helix domain-containing protein [Verrucomicrobiae bacterium]|jgi:uncharacterized iron-regulated membrane protein|nr:PepSY-associated TM helix domain-containing protein [Verrucomicrobiae bacterium]